MKDSATLQPLAATNMAAVIRDLNYKAEGNYILNCTNILTMILSWYKQIYENHIKSPNQYCSA